jgi:hypothetical protein
MTFFDTNNTIILWVTLESTFQWSRSILSNRRLISCKSHFCGQRSIYAEGLVCLRALSLSRAFSRIHIFDSPAPNVSF